MIAAIAGDVATGGDEVLLWEGDSEGPVVRFATDIVSAELLMPFASSVSRRLLFTRVVLSLRPIEVAFNKIWCLERKA